MLKRKLQFQKADYQETGRKLDNPGCGWYHIYTFSVTPSDIPRPAEDGFYLAEGSEDEQLVLLLVDIGDFRNREFSEEALAYIERILQFFREKDRQMILRFAYDAKGEGAEKEPSSLSIVKQHMKQLGSLAYKYAEDILVIQGIFLGSWGEMHNSKFLYQKAMTELVNLLYQETRGSCYLAVRTPSQWRTILSSRAAEPELEKRLTVFNDGIFASATDLGTYGIENQQDTEETKPWDRERELQWQDKWLRGKPNGGEALWGEGPTSYKKAAEEMKKMHLSYLNSVYDSKQLDFWKQESVKQRGCWHGMNGYEYIGRHLGYRFFICDVRLIKNTQLQIIVENSGFAELCEETDCFLILEKGDGSFHCQSIDTDARKWASGERTILEAALPWNELQKQCRLFLQLKRKRDGKVIRFANGTVGEIVMLGWFK